MPGLLGLRNVAPAREGVAILGGFFLRSDGRAMRHSVSLVDFSVHHISERGTFHNSKHLCDGVAPSALRVGDIPRESMVALLQVAYVDGEGMAVVNGAHHLMLLVTVYPVEVVDEGGIRRFRS